MPIATRVTTDDLKSKLLIRSRDRRQHHADARAVEQAVGDEPACAKVGKLRMKMVKALQPAARRGRKTSPAQLQRVIRSVRLYGVVAPVIVGPDNSIINGHIVVEAAAELGLTWVPVVDVEHLDSAERRGLRIALNRLGETGEWDLPELSIELGELQATGLDLTDTGFSLPELDIIMLADGSSDPAKTDAADELPTPIAQQVSVRGDIWVLGDHRIICEDATEPETYEKLLEGKLVHGSFGDPPFNIPIAGFVSGLGKTKHQDFVQGVGEMSEAEFTEFLRKYLECCSDVSVAGAAIFACMDWRSQHLLCVAGAAAGLKHVNTCVWNKGSGGMGQLYRSTHEMVLVFCKGAKLATNNVALGKHGRDRCNVWNYPGANRQGSSAAKALKLHATPKPVAMVEDAICDVTNRGELILDPFLGSGTTLIAAHTTGRLGRFIELDPHFVDVAIRRFTELTGIRAVHAATGLTFDETALERAT